MSSTGKKKRDKRRRPAATVRQTRVQTKALSETLHRAVALHQSGQLDQAEEIYHEILRVEPRHSNALHLIGVAAFQRRQPQKALDYISRAIAIHDKASAYHFNLGNAFRDLDRPEEAIRAYQRALKLQPSLADAHFALGNILKAQGRCEEALESYRRALEYRPEFAATHFNMGNLFLDQGQLGRAVAAYKDALLIEPEYGEAHKNLAHAYELQEDWDQAISSYRKALELEPHDTKTLNGLGIALRHRGEFAEAAREHRKAIQVNPKCAVAHSNLGMALLEMKESDEAAKSYQTALEIDPRLVDTYGELAWLHESSNRIDEALALAALGLEIEPDNVICNLITAKCLRHVKRYDEAIERLVKVAAQASESRIARDVNFELGRLYEHARQSNRAYEHFVEANRVANKAHVARGAEASRYAFEVEQLNRFYSTQRTQDWSPVPPFAEDRTPVFLIGFPRSGTTLLDQVLDSHPRLQTLEEKPTVWAVKRLSATFPDNYPQSLIHLTPGQVERLRDAYFSEADRWVDRRPGTVLVDKHPLNTVNIGLILRVFPAARFILAIRHPCDCCLSCFMQEFASNDAMANFVTLEQATSLYANVMRLRQTYERVVPHRYAIVRYEDLVADFECETRRLLQFLGVEWDDAVLEYAQHARQRGRIDTPSYHQVTEPIYQRAKYRWLRYRKQLEPYLERLQPFIDYFGYSHVGLEPN